MKFAIVLMCALGLLSTRAFADDFEGEFFQGMESGFFLRDTPDGYKEYDCPDVAVDPEMMSTVNSFIQPVVMAVKLLQSPLVENLVLAI